MIALQGRMRAQAPLPSPRGAGRGHVSGAGAKAPPGGRMVVPEPRGAMQVARNRLPWKLRAKSEDAPAAEGVGAAGTNGATPLPLPGKQPRRYEEDVVIFTGDALAGSTFRQHVPGRKMDMTASMIEEEKRVPGWREEIKNIEEVSVLALPALGAVLADPFLSLVDTSCVGQVSSLELAALGPNTAIFNFFFQVFAFLGVATTSIIASNSISAPGIEDTERSRRRIMCERLLSTSMTLAVSAGVLCAILLLAFGPNLLALLGCTSEMMAPAVKYLRIRALASPAVLFNITMQGASMGQQDSMSPFKIYAFAGLFNFVFDAILILKLDFGIAGAAWATMAAQYVGAFAFYRLISKKAKEGTGINLKWYGMPGRKDLKPFYKVSQTLVMRSSSLYLSYSLMARAATMIGTLPLAAHQVAVQIFWFFSYVPEPLSMAAQSLIARDRTERAKVHKLARTLILLGGLAGAVLAACVGGMIVVTPWLFTSDPVVMGIVRTLAPMAMGAVVVCALVMIMDGVSLGSHSYDHLAPGSLLAMVATYLLLKLFGAVGAGIQGVWYVMFLFFVLRLGVHAVHFLRQGQRNPFIPYNGYDDGADRLETASR